MTNFEKNKKHRPCKEVTENFEVGIENINYYAIEKS